jgi:hypothetical protein
MRAIRGDVSKLRTWFDKDFSLMDMTVDDGRVIRDVLNAIVDLIDATTFPTQIISPVLGLIPIPPDLDKDNDTWFSDGYIAVNVFQTDEGEPWQYNVFVDKLNPATGLREYNTDVQLCHGICS